MHSSESNNSNSAHALLDDASRPAATSKDVHHEHASNHGRGESSQTESPRAVPSAQPTAWQSVPCNKPDKHTQALPRQCTHNTPQQTTADHSTPQHATARHSTPQPSIQHSAHLFQAPFVAFVVCCQHQPHGFFREVSTHWHLRVVLSTSSGSHWRRLWLPWPSRRHTRCRSTVLCGRECGCGWVRG